MSDDEHHLLDIWRPDSREADRHLVIGEDDQPVGVPRPASSPKRGNHRRRGVGAIIAVVVLLAIVAVLVTGGYVGYHRIKGKLTTPDYPGTGSGTVTVVVKQGDTAADIADTMVSAGVVKSVKAFRDAAVKNPRSITIQPGTYRLRAHMKASAALSLLLDPAAKLLLRFTVPEGFTVAQILSRVAHDTAIPLADLRAAAGKPQTLGLPSWAKNRLEGFLFPATYNLQPGASATEALKAMVAKFTAEATASNLRGRAAALKITPYALLTVASIVEKEGVPGDFGKIARVIYNRLANKQRLQLDSTLNYALPKPTGHPSAAQTRTPSPYNTYTVSGLPPTPISNPGLASLAAAGAPSRGPWLYFVTVSKDGHAFFTDNYAAFVARKQQAQREGVY